MRLKDDIDIFKKSTKPQKSVKKEKKHYFLEMKIIFLIEWQKVLNAFGSGIIQKGKQGRGLANIILKHLKNVTSKQMLQRLPIALAQKKTNNTSENLLNEIIQIKYSLQKKKKFYKAKEITKKVYNSIMNSIKL